ncbi:MAG: SDR family oxidoreductase [Leptospiraceae bacterium]|nr:SDR family oxidoreductase [Leptospiraceae bacterium]MDW8307622.1 SDR family oxidoreductase [Leptospiraceae bacterium]
MGYLPDYRYVVLITGCSSGIGFATSLLLAENGVRVFAGLRQREKIGMLDEEAAKRGIGHLLTPVELNVDSHADIERVVRLVIEREEKAWERGAEPILINNAGFAIIGALEDLSMEAYERQFRTNFFGPVALVKAIVPTMRQLRRGKIIQLSSAFGRLAIPVVSAYASSKFALEGFSESLRYELLRYNIYVSLVEPGPVLSNFVDNLEYAQNHESSLYREQYRKYQDLAEISALVAQSPAEIAHLIWKIIQEKTPRLRYPVGITNLAENLKRVLPETFIDELSRLF